MFQMDEDIDIITNGDDGGDTSTSANHLTNLQISFTSHEKDGSLHALQTAYGELKKRFQEQISRNAVLQTSIREMEMQRISSGRPNSGVFGAAGPSSDACNDNEQQAQLRAEFGFAQSLERQIIRAKSTLSKLESDNKQLQKKIERLEEDLRQAKGKECEQYREIETLKKEIQKLSQKNIQEFPQKEIFRLESEKESLKNQLQQRDSEVSRLQTHLQQYETFPRKDEFPQREVISQSEIENLRNQLHQRDDLIHTLQERCRMLENKNGMPSMSSVSLDEEKRILEQVESYSKTIKTLKAQVQDQGKMLVKQQEAIKKLIENSKLSSISPPNSRYAAEGASYNPTMTDPHYKVPSEATYRPHMTGNLSTAIAVNQNFRPVFPTLQTLPPEENKQDISEMLKAINFSQPEVPRSRGQQLENNYHHQRGYSDSVNKYPLVDLGSDISKKDRNSNRHHGKLQSSSGLNMTEFSQQSVTPPFPRTEEPSLYENLVEIVPEKTGKHDEKYVPSSAMINIGSQTRVGSHIDPLKMEQNDYVNIKDIHPHRTPGNIPTISPRVTLVPDDEINRHQQSSRSPRELVVEPPNPAQFSGRTTETIDRPHILDRITPNAENVNSSQFSAKTSSSARADKSSPRKKNGIPHVNRIPQENVNRSVPTNKLNLSPQNSPGPKPGIASQTGNSQICPVCGQNFVNINMENFQMHVFNCMDSDNSQEEQYGTLQNATPSKATDKDNRICPMCDASYPSELQTEFERHVQEHFGEEPIVDRFEVLNP